MEKVGRENWKTYPRGAPLHSVLQSYTRSREFVHRATGPASQAWECKDAKDKDTP